MPAMIGGFGNFLLPLLVGGPDMAKKMTNIVNKYFNILFIKLKRGNAVKNCKIFNYDFAICM
jgi:heme/copper-type cytochrome/quinol oxidase subunit 1